MAIKNMAGYLKLHRLTCVDIKSQAHYATKGHPASLVSPDDVTYHPQAHIQENSQAIDKAIEEKACYVIGSNVKDEQLRALEFVLAYKKQNDAIERGFRFLKDPYFFAPSFFIKKPSRLMAMLTIMTLSLLVYSIAQRRIRTVLQEKNETLPNQIGLPTPRPTLRWIFQLLEGIHVVYIRTENTIKKMLTGVDELKRKILCLFPQRINKIYRLIENNKNAMHLI